MKKLFYLLPLACFLLLVGCDAPTSSLADDEQDFLTADAVTDDHLNGFIKYGSPIPDRSEFGFGLGFAGRQFENDRLVNAVRVRTERFLDVNEAIAAGYVSTEECVSVPGLGTMGIHFVNPALAGDAKISAFEPEVLLYLPESDGTMRLVAVEYVVSRAPWEATPGNQFRTPHLAGIPFARHFGEEARHGLPDDHFDLHLWAHQENSAGAFAEFNPDLSCPE